MMGAELGVHMWFERVPTDYNIADSPSRQKYAILERLRAEKVEPKLDERFWTSDAIDSLSCASLLQIQGALSWNMCAL